MLALLTSPGFPPCYWHLANKGERSPLITLCRPYPINSTYIFQIIQSHRNAIDSTRTMPKTKTIPVASPIVGFPTSFRVFSLGWRLFGPRAIDYHTFKQNRRIYAPLVAGMIEIKMRSRLAAGWSITRGGVNAWNSPDGLQPWTTRISIY